MNRFGKLTFSAALLTIASACNQASDNQASEGANVRPSTEAQMISDALQDNGALAAPQEPETSSQPATNTAAEARPKARASTPDRTPPPKAPRPQPEPDPHAGHDMGNMANMSHD